jgi:hypothetical protein
MPGSGFSIGSRVKAAPAAAVPLATMPAASRPVSFLLNMRPSVGWGGVRGEYLGADPRRHQEEPGELRPTGREEP